MRSTRHLAVALVGALVWAGVLVLRAAGWLQGLELTIYDQYVRYASPPLEGQAAEQLVLVEITEEDIQDLVYPVSDRVLAESLRRLVDGGARTIGVDIYRDLPVPPGEQLLARTLREEPRIIAVHKSGGPEEGGIPGPRALQGSDRTGFTDIVPDPDATVRRALLYQGDGEMSFALRVVLAALAQDGIHPAPDPDHPDWLRLGPATVRPFETNDGGYAGEDAGGYQFLLSFATPREGFANVTLGELLRGELPPDFVRDKVVLLGANAPSLPDRFPVPYLRHVENGIGIPGLRVHAHVVQDLLSFGLGEASPLRVLSEKQEALLIALFAALGCIVGLTPRGSPILGVSTELLSVAAGFVLLWMGGWLAFRMGWWIPVVAPGLAWLVSAGVVTAWSSSREHAQRALLMQLFSRHVSPRIADEIWRQRKAFFHEGRPRSERMMATVLFLDMKGYTAHAEKMDPQRLMTWVNEFMEAMAHEVDAYGGVVDDYFGDGLKANFGVPFARSSVDEIADDARRAVSCALGMAQGLEDLNTKYRQRGLPAVGMRIGIHTGPVVAGSLGSAERLKYTVVGDVVVTAQRLESTDRVAHDFEHSPCRILISEATRSHLDPSFRCEPKGNVTFKGKDEVVTVYGVRG